MRVFSEGVGWRGGGLAFVEFIRLGTDPLQVEFSGNYMIEDEGLYESLKFKLMETMMSFLGRR